MIKIVTIVGARPQFIKAATLSREIGKSAHMKEVMIHTGQHYDDTMSSIFFESMDIKQPDYNLSISDNRHGKATGIMIEQIEAVLLNESPDFVILFGDTNSTLAGVIAASKLNIQVAHIEAGLRSYNMKMPEEINRILTDRISKILFCPTAKAVENLKKEGFENFDCKIIQSGDIMYDGALYYRQFSSKPNHNIKEEFILCTLHRAENTNNLNKLQEIVESLNELSKKIQVVFPIHPRTKKAIETNGLELDFTPVEPQGYFETLWLLENCQKVLTDSGGLQKEAYFFKKPCLVLREETEWEELVENGYAIICGSKKEKILNAFYSFRFATDSVSGLYGDGNASKIIVEELLR